MLGIDLVLGALIGPPGTGAEMIIDRAEAGEWTPVVLDLALYCAMASVRPGDAIDHARFARLLRYAELESSGVRTPGMPLPPPSPEEIEHWRDVVFGRDGDPDDPSDTDDEDNGAPAPPG